MKNNLKSSCTSSCRIKHKSLFKHFKSSSILIFITISFTLGFVYHVHAEGPAVSKLNTSVGGLVGYDFDSDFNGDIFGSIGGNVRAPIGDSFGISVGVGVGASSGDGDDDDSDDDRAIGYGVSGFWRDPEVGAIGIGVGRGGVSGEFNTRVSLGAAYFTQKWTLSAGGGRQRGDTDTWSGGMGLGYYINDDLLIAGSASGGDHFRGSATIAWQPNKIDDMPNFALFASTGNGFILGGFTLYFGTGDKSLKRRHRED